MRIKPGRHDGERLLEFLEDRVVIYLAFIFGLVVVVLAITKVQPEIRAEVTRKSAKRRNLANKKPPRCEA